MADLVPGGQRARVFLFDASGVRVVGTWDAPWFIAKDVCHILEIQNVSQALENLDPDEKGVSITYTLGGPQELLTVSESGLYALIFRSRKEQARIFRKWVTSEVLPQIRSTGSYVPLTLSTPRPTRPRGRPALPPRPPVPDRRVEDLIRFVALALGDAPSRMLSKADLASTAQAGGLFGWMFKSVGLRFSDPKLRESQARAYIGLVIRHFGAASLPLPSGDRCTILADGFHRARCYLITRIQPEGHA